MSNQGQPETEYIIISNEEGEKERFQILLTFEQDETGRKYMLVTPEEEETVVDNDGEELVEQEVYAFRYEGDDDHLTLYTIEDDSDEWDMIEEVLNTLQPELEDENE